MAYEIRNLETGAVELKTKKLSKMRDFVSNEHSFGREVVVLATMNGKSLILSEVTK